jgi:hypothetical protein
MKNILGTATTLLLLSLTLSACSDEGAVAESDIDGDGLTDRLESALKTDPRDRDSDDDGVEDGKEYENATDPLQPDSDADGIEDGDEDEDEDGIEER